MTGWVRVFSNTIGLAVAKNIYSDLFKLNQKKTNPTNPTEVDLGIVNSIYNDPSKDYLIDNTIWCKIGSYDELLRYCSLSICEII